MRPRLAPLLTCLLLTSLAQAADLKVENAWVRATAPGQQVAGGFLDLTAPTDMALVGGSSPVSASLELHIMKMANGMMEMRQVKEIDLPKGRTVNLKPGGLHLMFIGLKGQIKAGDKVPITLTVKDRNGHEASVSVVAEAHAGAMPHH